MVDLDIVSINKKLEALNTSLIGYNRALLNFTYNNEEGCKFILDNKEILEDIAFKFDSVSTGLQGDFTKAYAANIGTKYILDGFRGTIDKIYSSIEEITKHIKGEVDLLKDKQLALETETNNITTVGIVNNIIENKIYNNFTNETLRKRVHELSPLISNSKDPVMDLAKVGVSIVDILSSINKVLTFAIGKFKFNVDDISDSYTNNKPLLATTDLLAGYKDKLPKPDILSDTYLGEKVRPAVIENLEFVTLPENTHISSYTEALLFAAKYYLDTLVPTLKNTINSLSFLKDQEFHSDLTQAYDVVLSGLKAELDKMGSVSITNEEYMDKINRLQPLLNKCREDFIQLSTILHNSEVIILWITDEIANLYGAIYQSIQFAE